MKPTIVRYAGTATGTFHWIALTERFGQVNIGTASARGVSWSAQPGWGVPAEVAEPLFQEVLQVYRDLAAGREPSIAATHELQYSGLRGTSFTPISTGE